MPTGGGGGGSKASPITFYETGNNISSQTPAGVNQIFATGFWLPIAITFSHISFWISTTDNANNYDIGIYNSAGTLVADIGPQHLPTAQLNTIATVQGALTIQPGLYVAAFCGAATTAAMGIDNARMSWFYTGNAGTSVAAQLPSTITAPTNTLHTGVFQIGLS